MIEFLGFIFQVFFSFTLCTISIGIIRTTHIMTVCLSPPLRHCIIALKFFSRWLITQQ